MDWRTPWIINIVLLMVYCFLQVWTGFSKAARRERQWEKEKKEVK